MLASMLTAGAGHSPFWECKALPDVSETWAKYYGFRQTSKIIRLIQEDNSGFKNVIL